MEMWLVDESADTCPAFLRGEATWRSLNTNVATVNVTGVVHPVAAGTTLIEATYGGLTVSATVTVAGTWHEKSILMDTTLRTYSLYVPPGMASGTPAPLVLSMHGGGGTAHQQARTSQLARTAAAEGFLVAFPDGSRSALPIQTWNGGTCCGPAAAGDVDDVGFLRAVVEDVASDFDVDQQRVFASGHSNGGIMSHRLACEASDVFAAIAPVDGGLNVDGVDFVACAPLRPVPVLMMHGTTDANYPIQGGTGGIGTPGEQFYPVVLSGSPNTLDDWRAVDGALGEGVHVLSQGIASCTLYAGDADVEMCILTPPVPRTLGDVVCDGGGHAWPGGVKSLQANADVPAADVDAAAIMWAFFAAHPMPL